MTSLTDSALTWAKRGIPVFPLRPREKTPATAHGVKDASTDPASIAAWWGVSPQSNVGGAMGGWVWCLDLDGDTGIASLAALEAEHGALPETLTVRTGGGGRHLFFLLPDGIEIRNSASKVGPKIDVRGIGGYVVLPPSVHPNGTVYTVERDVRPVLAPEWLVALVVAKAKAAPPPGPQAQIVDLFRGVPDGGSDDARLAGIVRAACDRILSAPQGTRNATVNEACYAIGGWLDGLGGSVDQVAPDLEAAALAADQPVSMVRRSLEVGRATPRGRPPDAPPTWYDRASSAIEAGDPAALLQDPEVLMGLVRPSGISHQIEALLQRLPHAARTSLTRAGKNLVKAARVERKAHVHADLPLVVEHGGLWRVLEGTESYLPVDRGNIAAELGRLHQIDTLITTEHGSRYMTSVEVYGVHGVTALRVRWTYDATGPSWDPVTRVLDIPGARVRVGRSERSDLVEGWLDQFVAPTQRETFLDWLATAHLLDRPTSSPQFRGPDSAGKALLVAGLTTWLGGRTDYTHATDDFNAGLIFAPLVVLDEGTAESMPDAFRRLTGNREHQVTAKNRMPEELRGCPRVVVTSNEPDPLRLGREELSSHSETALGRRILVFDVQQSAADYLAFIGGWDATADWATADGDLVAHLRWLAETRTVVPGKRFLVEGDAAQWVGSAHSRVGLAGDVVQAFETYRDMVEESTTGEIIDPQPFYFDPLRPAVVGVNVRGLQAHWARLVGDQKSPSHQRLSAVLRRLSGQDQPVRPGSKADRGPRVYLVTLAKLERGS